MKTIGNMFRGVRLFFTGLVLLAVAIFGGLGLIHHYSTQPPPISKAGYEVETSSLTYLTNKVWKTPDGSPEITGYWVENGDRWVYSSGSLSFPVQLYGPVEIIPRAN